MKVNKLKKISFLMAFLILFTAIPFNVFAAENKAPEEWINSKSLEISDIYSKKEPIKNPMEIVSLAKYHQVNGTLNKNTINKSTIDYLYERNEYDIRTLAPKILALRASGIDPENYYDRNLVENLANLEIDPTTKVDILSLGLGALHSDNYSKSPTVKKAEKDYIDLLLSKQNSNGIWSNYNDTGHAIYALAPFYKTDNNVKNAIDKALEYISNNLNNSARLYPSFESQPTSYLAGAISSLDANLINDSRFIKNGNTMYDGLRYFEIAEGFKTHDFDDKHNDNSTEIAFRALVSYLSSINGKGHIYDFRGTPKRVLPETKKDDEWIVNKAKAIGDVYNKSGQFTDPAKSIDFAKYYEVIGKHTEGTINRYSLANLRKYTFDENTNEPKKDLITLSNSILAVRSAGLDPEDYYGYNLVELLAKSDLNSHVGYTVNGVALNALISDEYPNSPSVNQAIENNIKILLDNQGDDGLWTDLNQTANVINGLAPFYDSNPEVKNAVDKAVKAVSEKLLDNADFTNDPGNASTLALIIGAISNVNPDLIASDLLIKSEKTMIDALKEYEQDYGFKKFKNDTMLDDRATEQSFRALISYLSMRNNKGQMFNFRNIPKRRATDAKIPEDWITRKASELYSPFKANLSEEDLNYVLPIAKYELITGKDNSINTQTLNTVKNKLVDNDGNLNSNLTLSTLSNGIIIIRAAGIDPEHYYGNNLIEKLAGMVDASLNISMEELTLAINALNTDNYNVEGIENKKREYINKLVSKQKEAGLWDSLGDETAEPLAAIAPFYKKSDATDINQSVNKAINRLSNLQLDNGDIKDEFGQTSFMTLFPAIKSITNSDLYLLTDPRITKDDKTLYDVMRERYDITGGFKFDNSSSGKDSDATRLGNAALVSYLSMKNGYGSIYDFSKAPKKSVGEYIVTFETNGGSKVPEKHVGAGKTVIKPESPKKYDNSTKTDYTFKGWFIDEEFKTEYNFENPVNNNLTLYAKWEAVKKEVKVSDDWIKEKAEEIYMPAKNDIEAYEDLNAIQNISKYELIEGKKSSIPQKTLDTIKSNLFHKQTGELINNPITIAKSIIGLRAAGYDPENYYGENLIEALINSDFDSLEIQNLALLLTTLSTDDYKSEGIDEARRKIINAIINKQQEDGLWDSKHFINSTADVLTALSPYYKKQGYENVTESVEKAINAISKLQLPNGDFTEDPGNAYYLSQIVVAIANLDPELLTDPRLAPNGNTMMDALKEYETEGGFKFTKDEPRPSVWVTEVAKQALVSHISQTEGYGGLANFEKAPKSELGQLTVKFDYNDGSNPVEVKTGEGRKLKKPENPTRTGYEFAGWFTDSKMTSEFDFNKELNKSDDNMILYAKWESLVEENNVDKSKLQEAITNSEKLFADMISENGENVPIDKTWVTEDVNNALNDALTEAKKVAGDEEATQEDVDKATDELNNAISNYNPQFGTKEKDLDPETNEVDKSELEDAINNANKLIKADVISVDGKDVDKDKTWITKENEVALDSALTEARKILANDEATQEDVVYATTELINAISNYKPLAGSRETSKPDYPLDPRPEEPKPIDPASSIDRRYYRDTTEYLPFIPGLGFVTPGRVYTTPSVDTRPIETKPTETKPTNEIKPVVPVFTDIIGHWAEPAINSVVAKDYFKGTGVDTFSPNRAITRAELVTVLGRIAGVNPANYTNTTMTDVEHGSYYEGYVNWAVEKGLVNGVGENKFDPNSEASREEVATIISRYLDMIGKNNTATSELSYKDSQEISQWAKDAVNKLTELGVFNGQDGNKFAASESITRAEIAQVIYNMDNANLIK